MKIAIFTRKLSNVMGGMERQLSSIADGFARNGHQVVIVTLDKDDPKPFFEVNESIALVGLNIGDPSKKATLRIRFIRQRKVYELLKENQIDLSVAFMTGSFWYAVVPSRLLKTPIVLAERNGPSIYFRTSAKKLKSLIFMSMSLSSAISVQFETYRRHYPFYLRGRIVAIPNLIPTFKSKVGSNELPLKYLFAGRFSNQKQVLELVAAFVDFHSSYPETSLSIYGEGELHEVLYKKVELANATSYIKINPPTKDIEAAFRGTDVMVAPSLWEGFPNSVAEALAYGIPVGGFSDCEGVRDLVMDKENGWLIERTKKEDPCYELLKTIYLERDSISKKSEAAIKSMQRYQGDESNIKWCQLAESLVTKRFNQR